MKLYRNSIKKSIVLSGWIMGAFFLKFYAFSQFSIMNTDCFRGKYQGTQKVLWLIFFKDQMFLRFPLNLPPPLTHYGETYQILWGRHKVTIYLSHGPLALRCDQQLSWNVNKPSQLGLKNAFFPPLWIILKMHTKIIYSIYFFFLSTSLTCNGQCSRDKWGLVTREMLQVPQLSTQVAESPF